MLGTIFRQQGETAAALKELRETIRLNPASSEAYNSIGQILTSAHDAAGAAEAFTEARRLNRIKADSQAAVFAVNAGLERLKRNDIAGAIAKFREAIRLSPDSAQAHYRLPPRPRRRRAPPPARKEDAAPPPPAPCPPGGTHAH